MFSLFSVIWIFWIWSIVIEFHFFFFLNFHTKKTNSSLLMLNLLIVFLILFNLKFCSLIITIIWFMLDTMRKSWCSKVSKNIKKISITLIILNRSSYRILILINLIKSNRIKFLMFNVNLISFTSMIIRCGWLSNTQLIRTVELLYFFSFFSNTQFWSVLM